LLLEAFLTLVESSHVKPRDFCLVEFRKAASARGLTYSRIQSGTSFRHYGFDPANGLPP
jgi:hypothetical protein